MQKVNFNPFIISSVLGENKSIDLPRLFLQDRQEALNFLHTYGFDLSHAEDLKSVWKYHRDSIEILEKELLTDDEKIPSILRNKEELGDITKLFLIASTTYSLNSKENESIIKTEIKSHSIQTWACAILKVMHVLIHLDNDLFSSFTDDIKYQILKPIQQHIHNEDQQVFLGLGEERIELCHYQEKSLKQKHSGVIKLLARQDLIAMTLLDRVGVRFITKNIVDIFRVVQYLVDHNLISYPHVISSLSKNTICPTPLFMNALEACVSNEGRINLEDLNHRLNESLNKNVDSENSVNPFTSDDFKFLKFITRQFLKIDRGPDKKKLRFFYPFEIQILDEKTFEANLRGEASHEEYKKRQKLAARQRVFSDI